MTTTEELRHMMTNTEDVRSPRTITADIHELMSKFVRAQDKVEIRINEIHRGELLRGRIATRVLMGRRDRARQKCIEFLDDLSENENDMMAVAFGSRNWRAEYDRKLDPEGDPQV